jgi:hypothetical protein
VKKNNIILWISAIVITFIIIYALNLFNSDYPITGTFGIDGKKVSYRFEKMNYGKDSVNILIRSDVKELVGLVYWKSQNDSNWISKKLIHYDLALDAKIPSQRPNTAIKYYVKLIHKDKTYLLPNNQKVKMNFYGKIPGMINFLRFLLWNLGLLVVVRVGLEYFNKNEKTKKFELFIAAFLLTLTILVNPLYLSYKYGLINTSIPSINTLFPVKELAVTSLWIITIVLTFNIKKLQIAPLVSAVITIILLFLFN